MAITALPAVPLRSDPPETFVAKADAFLSAIKVFATEANAVALAMNFAATNGTSVTSLVMALGAQTLTTQASKSYVVGMAVQIALSTNGSVWMNATVTAYNSTTGLLVVNVTDMAGSGTYAAWVISQSSPPAIKTVDLQNQTYTGFVAGGTPPAYTLTTNPTFAAYVINQRLRIDFNTSLSYSAATLNVNGLGAKSIKQYNELGVKVDPIIASQLCDIEYDGTDFVILNPIHKITNQIQPITATVATNILTIGLGLTSLDFRSPSLTSGTVNTRCITNNISINIPAGASLGSVSALINKIAVLALDLGTGVVELAVVNMAGGLNLDETTLISTTAISAASTAANVIYSTTARTALPFRVVGYIESTQATAGTWATAPSTIQGQGGQAAAISSLGYGQTWQIPTRAANVTYYNTTGRPIQVLFGGSATGGGGFYCNSVNIGGMAAGALFALSSLNIIVPPGGSYIFSGTGTTINFWNELR